VRGMVWKSLGKEDEAGESKESLPEVTLGDPCGCSAFFADPLNGVYRIGMGDGEVPLEGSGGKFSECMLEGDRAWPGRFEEVSGGGVFVIQGRRISKIGEPVLP